MLYAICYMLHAICYMLHAICDMLYAICYMLYATCYITLTASPRIAVMPRLHLVQTTIASVTLEPGRREVVCRSMNVSTNIWCYKIRGTNVVHDVDSKRCVHFVHRALHGVTIPVHQ